MSATLLFNESGRNKKYVPQNDNKSKDEILEKLARESYSTFNTWPQESPKAGYYDTRNSATKLILLNNNKKWSHLRGKTKAKQPRLVKDNNYEWVEIEKMKQNQFPKSKALARSQSSRSVDPARHLTPRHCTFKAEYDDTLMLPVNVKKHNERNKSASRLFTSVTKSKFDDIDELEWLAYLHAMGVRTTGYQTYYKKPQFPIEYRSSYNLNHPKFDKNYLLYLNELYKSYSVSPSKNLKQLQYMNLLKQRKAIDKNCKYRYRFHRGDDFYTYDDYLTKPRPVPHQVNTGYFSKRRAKSAKTVRRAYASPRPSKTELYDTNNCEEARKPTHNQSNSEMSHSQFQQSIVDQSDSALDSSLNDKSSATKMTSSAKISPVNASSRTLSSSSSSSSSSSESGSPRPANRASTRSSGSTKPKTTLTSSSRSQKHVKVGVTGQQTVLPSRNVMSASSSIKSRQNDSPVSSPMVSPKTSGVKTEQRKSIISNRTPTPEPFNRPSVPAKVEHTLQTLNSKSPSSAASTPKGDVQRPSSKLSRSSAASTVLSPRQPEPHKASTNSSSAAASPDKKPLLLPRTTSFLSSSESSRTQNVKEKAEPKRTLSKLTSTSSSKTPSPVHPLAQTTRRSSMSSKSSTVTRSSPEKTSPGNKPGSARKYDSSSASSFVMAKNPEITARGNKSPDSLHRLMKKPLSSSDTD